MLLKALHILLIVNVLLSSTGMPLFEHLCLKKGRTAFIYIKPKSCCYKTETAKSSCKKSTCCKSKQKTKKFGIHQKPCCNDKITYLKADTDGRLSKNFSIFDLKAQVLVVNLVPFALISDFVQINQKILRFILYKPPPTVTDIRVLVQSFRC